MASIVVATLNISFSEEAAEAEGDLKLEIDDREDGLNGGNTSFKPGDDAYFFRFKGDNVTILSQNCSAGGLSGAGTGTKDIDENITFSNSDSGSLGYPPDGTVTMKWLGKSFEITKDGTVSNNTSLPEVSGSTLTMPNNKSVIGVLNCVYESTGDLFKLSGVPVDFLETIVFAVGSVT